MQWLHWVFLLSMRGTANETSFTKLARKSFFRQKIGRKSVKFQELFLVSQSLKFAIFLIFLNFWLKIFKKYLKKFLLNLDLSNKTSFFFFSLLL